MNAQAHESDLRPSKPRRRRRWLWRGLFALMILLGIILITAQIILMSDIPRRLVIAQVQQRLGLRMTASGISTGWLGHTTIRDATLSLPLADEPLLTTPHMVVRHTNLLFILLGSFDLNGLEIEAPLLDVRQSASGEWNAIQAVSLIRRMTDSGQTSTGKPNRPVKLPEIRITNGKVIVRDRMNQTTTIQPVTVIAAPEGPLIYRYDARLSDNLQIVGQVTPAASWEHELNFTASNIDNLIQPLVKNIPKNINAKGTWTGQLEQNRQTTGRIDLTSLSVGQLSARGAARINVLDGAVEVSPQTLLIKLANSEMPESRIVSGAIKVDANSINTENLQIGAYDGQAVVNGKWNRVDNSAELRAAWRELSPRGGINLSGTVEGSMRTPWAGRPQLQASITSSVRIEAGTVDTALKISGEGDSFQSIDWNTNIDHITLTGRHAFDLRQVTARLRTRGEQVMLDEMHFSEHPHLDGQGQYDPSKQFWWLWMQGGEDLPLASDENDKLPVAINLNAWGRPTFVNLTDLFVRVGDLEVTGNGFYDSEVPKPVNLQLRVSHFVPAHAMETSEIVRGQLDGQLQVMGTVTPPNLGLNGELRIDGNGLAIKKRMLGDIRLELVGKLDTTGATLRTTEMELLGGRWTMLGAWPGDRNQPATLDVEVRSLPIADLADLAQVDNLSGDLNSHVQFIFPDLHRSRMTAVGAFSATDLRFKQILAQRAIGKIDLRNGILRLKPIDLANRDGRGTANVELPLDRLNELDVELSLTRWPLMYDQTDAVITGHTKLSLDLAQHSAAGPVVLETTLSDNNRSLGTFKVEADILRQTITANHITAELLGGTADGSATVNVTDLLESRAQLNWKSIDASTFSSWIPRLDGLTGRLSGSATLGPGRTRHALGPLQLQLTQLAQGAQYNGMEVGDLAMTIYFDRDRAVTQDSHFNFAGGETKLFARVARRPQEAVSSLFTAEFKELDLNQIVHAVDTTHKEPMPGRIDGHFTFGGDPGAPKEMFGEGQFNLTRSDLVNFDPLGELYRKLNANAPGSRPTGTAKVSARLEGSNLSITSARIFNRGVEIRGVLDSTSIWALPDNPISGTAVGSARPLHDLKLPFLADVDQIMNVLQSNFTPVRVSGTLRNPKVESGVFADIGDELRGILIGDAKAESKSQPK